MSSFSEEPAPEAARDQEQEARQVRLRKLAEEAMADPDFVTDLREIMQAFRFVDTEHWPPYDED